MCVMRYMLVFAVLGTGDAGDARKGTRPRRSGKTRSSMLRANEERQSMTEMQMLVCRNLGYAILRLSIGLGGGRCRLGCVVLARNVVNQGSDPRGYRDRIHPVRKSESTRGNASTLGTIYSSPCLHSVTDSSSFPFGTSLQLGANHGFTIGV